METIATGSDDNRVRPPLVAAGLLLLEQACGLFRSWAGGPVTQAIYPTKNTLQLGYLEALIRF